MTRDSAPAATRRSFLGAVAGTAALGAVPAATAQESDTVTTPVAVAQSAPTLSGQDYTGLFVHIAGPADEQPNEGARQCPFDAGGTIVTWDAILIDRANDNQQADAIIHAEQGAEALQSGNLFIVSDQRSCDSNFVQLVLEQVGASNIEVETTETESGGTGISVPGFGAATGLAGILGAGWLAKRRSDGD